LDAVLKNGTVDEFERRRFDRFNVIYPMPKGTIVGNDNVSKALAEK
jgi:hypothetical protein